jgi:hypothetical protein
MVPGWQGTVVGGRSYPEPNRARRHRDDYGFVELRMKKGLTYFYAEIEEGRSVGADRRMAMG